ncbi:MAG: hypothetical protein MEQ07_06720 [Aquimonas sp.]|nr:hypothetical protein [Aquimonas sp.]
MPSKRTVPITAGAAATSPVAGGALLGRGADHEAAAQALWSPRPPMPGRELHWLVHQASLAANSHNAQPWRFRSQGAGLLIAPDFNRRLPVADPDDHHLYVSLGCAAENLRLAATALGRSATLDFAGADGVRVLLGSGAGPTEPLFEAIAERQCTRSDYDGRGLQAAQRELLLEAACIEGCELLLVEDRARMEQVLELVLEANTRQVSNPAFAAELKHWIRFNAAAAIESGDGLYAASSGNPSLPTWLGRRLFDWVFKPAAENRRYARQLRSSAGLALFTADVDSPDGWARVGQAYQRFALQATALGLRHAHVNQPLEVAALRPQLASLLGLGTRRPDLLLRYGFAPPMPRSLRRPVEAVLDA